MTLVSGFARGFDFGSSNNTVPMMLSLQPQQYHQARSPPSHHIHRGNVIVTANNNNNNNNNNELKQVQAQQQQDQVSPSAQKRKMYAQATPYSGATHQPASVARRNARERNRVKQVNNGFATLRQHIPQTLAQALGGNTVGTQGGARAGSKKLSKVETLRMAVEYIRNLQSLLEEHDAELASTSGSSSAGSPQSDMEHHHHHHQQHHHQPTEIKLELKTESPDEDMLHHHQHQYHHLQPQQQHQPQHQQYEQQQHRQNSPVYIPTPCSEASSSPTPSFVSEASSAGGSQGYGTTNFTNAIYAPNSDGYDSYEPMSPEDEELLDYISMWQQGQ